MKRDQVVGVVAAVVAAVSAALPWINHVDVLYETNGKTSLGAFGVPITFLFSGASDTPGGSIPAVAVVVAVVALGLIVWTFLPRTPRRVLYIVWGLVAIAAPVLLYLQLQSDIDAKASITTKTVFTYYGIGPFVLMGAGLIAIVAGIIGAGKVAGAAAVPGPAVTEAPQYAGGAYPGGPAQQPWAPAGAPAQAPQPAQADWGLPQAPPQPQAPQWSQPAPQQWDPQPGPQQWNQPPVAPPTPPTPPPSPPQAPAPPV